jgi:hypothetical protein
MVVLVLRHVLAFVSSGGADDAGDEQEAPTFFLVNISLRNALHSKAQAKLGIGHKQLGDWHKHTQMPPALSDSLRVFVCLFVFFGSFSCCERWGSSCRATSWAEC